MILTMLLPPNTAKENLILAKQMGVNNLITKASPELSGMEAPYNIDSLRAVKEHFKKFDMNLIGLEGDQFDMAPIKLGLENRDEWIEKYKQMLRNMGELNIPLLCLNWMASIGWFRTQANIPLRGGALTSIFDYNDVKDKLLDKPLRITEKKLRDNLYYFLDAVLPVAEQSGVKMGLHPDDPPLSPIQGVGRILSSARDYEKVLKRCPSPNLGVTFCQATFKVMGEDVKKVSAKWIKKNKIFFVHIRDTEGDKYRFNEIFIDENGCFMSDMFKHYHKLGFNGVIRSDHAPAMGDHSDVKFEGSLSAGYQMTGHIFATGFIKGSFAANKIPLE